MYLYRQSKVYWSHTELDYDVPATIYCANLDGTDEQVLVDTDLLFVSKFNMRTVYMQWHNFEKSYHLPFR